jgi:hypothetical protein
MTENNPITHIDCGVFGPEPAASDKSSVIPIIDCGTYPDVASDKTSVEKPVLTLNCGTF